MDLQIILVGIIFAVAAFYLGRMVYRNIRPGDKKGSCGGCGNCGADFTEADKR